MKLFQTILSLGLVVLGYCFAVADSVGSPAFVRVSPRNPAYFELSDGQPYIPIGLNMIAPPGKEGWPVMESWMSQLSNHGGNFIRVWLSNPYFEVEHAKSGAYDPEKARRIDQMLDAARKNGIRVKMCLEHFRHLGEGRQPWAAKPMHKLENGGPAKDIADFFNGAGSREQFQRKLDWFGARYRHESQVFGWELWNEINAVSGGDYMAWTAFMLPKLHRLFPSNLCLQSLGSFDTDRVRSNYLRLAVMPGNDVAQVHRYLDLGASLDVCKGPVDLLAADAVRELLRANPQKPVILAESGAVEPRHTGPFKLYAQDTNGMILHDVLFAPFFVGAAGPGHIWHWDAYVAKNNLWWHFRRFAQVVEGLDAPAERFAPEMLPHERLRVYALKGARTTMLWCRDSHNTWQTELADGKPPETIAAATINLPWKPAAGSKVRFYDPWENRWHNVVLSQPGLLKLPPFRRSLVVLLP